MFWVLSHECLEASFILASHFGDIFAYSIKLSASVLRGGISVIALLCLCCCFYLYLSILMLGSAVLCQGVVRHDTLQCILNILKNPQALARTLPLSQNNPNKRTLMSVLHLYCLQRAHWELTDSIFHASAAGEDFNGTVFFPCSPFFSSKNSQRKKNNHKAKLFMWLRKFEIKQTKLRNDNYSWTFSPKLYWVKNVLMSPQTCISHLEA